MTNLLETEPMFVDVKFTKSERLLLKPKKHISTAEYAEENFVVVKGSKPGPWKNYNNPPLIGILNIFDRKGIWKKIKILVSLKAVQTGLSVLARIIHQKHMDIRYGNPGEGAGYAMENQRKSARICRQYTIPEIKANKELSKQLSTNPDDISSYSVMTKSGYCLNILWGGSSASVATDPYALLTLDEINKWSKITNLEEAKDRITTFKKGFINMLSTPDLEGGPIELEYNNTDAKLDYYVECPDCGEVQLMDFDNFDWPDKNESYKDDFERIKHANKIAREKSAMYVCTACGSMWDDFKRNKAVRLGLNHFHYGWKMQEDIDFPISVGIKYPSWISPFKSLSDIVARWLKANVKSSPQAMDLLQKWYNNEAATPFSPDIGGKIVEHEMLYARRKDYTLKKSDWQIPMQAVVLVASVDVQKNRLELETVAYGSGVESWGVEKRIFPGNPTIKYGQPGSPYNDLETYLVQSRWTHETGASMNISTTGIDSGNWTQFIYDYVQKSRAVRIFAVKGMPTKGRTLINISSAERKNTSNRQLDKYGIKLVTIGTQTAKDTLFSWMGMQEPGPGYMHYHTGYSLDYFIQLTVEQLITTWDKYGKPVMIWKNIKKEPNEAIDLRVYNYAMVELLNPNYEKILESLIKKAEKLKADDDKKDDKKDDENKKSKKPKSSKGTKGGGGFVNNY